MRPGPLGNDVDVLGGGAGIERGVVARDRGSFAPKILVDRADIVSPYM